MNRLKIVFLPSKRVAYRKINGRTVIISTEENKLIQLNETGTATWDKLDGRTVKQIAEDLAQEFDVAESQASHDLEEFLTYLESRHLVEAKEPTGA
jgi:hypothetical protein